MVKEDTTDFKDYPIKKEPVTIEGNGFF